MNTGAGKSKGRALIKLLSQIVLYDLNTHLYINSYLLIDL